MTQISAPRIEGVKPFPGQSENPRAVIGGNAPPPEEMIVIDFDAALDDEPNLRTRIAELLAKKGALPKCDHPETAAKFGDLMKIISTVIGKIEAHHATVKAPYLAATRAIDAKKRNLVDDLGELRAQANGALNTYLAEQRRLQAVEAARIAAEQERMRAEAAERQRIADVAIAKAVAEGAAVAPPPVEYEPEPEPEAPAAPEPIVLRGDLGARVGTKKTWKGEIESVRKLPNAILGHPNVIEALNKVIAGLIRGGSRDIKGVRVFEEETVSVR
jgi:hypothetical protein